MGVREGLDLARPPAGVALEAGLRWPFGKVLIPLEPGRWDLGCRVQVGVREGLNLA